MKKLITLLLFLSSIAQADLTNLDSFIFDSTGNLLNSTSGALNSFLTNSTLAVTQSGSWTTGRTWTLSSGTDSVTANAGTNLNTSLLALQSGSNSFLDRSGSGTLTALNTVVNITPSGMSTATIGITGTWIGTIQFQGQAGDGTWNAMLGFLPGIGTTVDALTANGSLSFPVGGFNQIRATFIAYTSGTATITWNLGAGVQGLQVFNLVGSNLQATVLGTGTAGTPSSGIVTIQGISGGTVVPGNITQLGGNSINTGAGATGTGTARIAANTYDGSGNAITSTTVGAKILLDVNAPPTDGIKASYSAAAIVTSAATATDVCVLPGSATKTIKVTQVRVSATGTVSTTVSVLLIKRSAADTGGTSTAMTVVPHDSTNVAGTAAPLTYTANPAVGASVGNVRAGKLDAVTSGGNGSPEIVWQFGDRPSQEIVLRGTAQQLAINLNSTSITGGSINCDFEYTEE